MAGKSIINLLSELEKEEIKIISMSDGGLNYLFKCSCGLYRGGLMTEKNNRFECPKCEQIYNLTPTKAERLKK